MLLLTFVTLELIQLPGRSEATFIHTGFSNWNDPGRTLEGHQRSDYHTEALLKLSLMQTTTPVIQQLSKKHHKDMQENRDQLMTVIKAVKYLSRQGLALRGTTEVKAV